MRSSSKMLVTGAFGGLAAVVVAGSGAFACTADATVGVVEGSGATSYMPEKAVVTAGAPMKIAVKSFESGKDVVVNWINPYTSAVTELARLNTTLNTATFTVPAGSYNSRHDKPYILQAIQSGTYTRSRQVFLTGGVDWVDPLPVGQTTGDAPATVADPGKPSTDIGAATEAPTSQVAAAAPVAGPANQVAATVAAVNATPTATAPSTAVAPTVQAAPAPIPVGAPAPAETNAPPTAELWSGLKADASGTLLETVDGTTPTSGGVPAGGIALLATGILSLAGVAFEATRRRLVLAKVTRQR